MTNKTPRGKKREAGDSETASAAKKRQKLEEDKRQKEEAKRKKEEVKRLKEEAKRQKEELEQEKKAKVERQSAAFKNFFVKLKTEEPKTWGWSNDLFMPFQIKEGMIVAPVFLRDSLSKDEYDSFLSTCLETSDYLSSIFKLKRKRIAKDPMRAKYFHFHDNYRPPYYGTWRKVSKVITGRRPLALSTKELDYDADSDGEWEEEQAEAGEDISSDVEEGGYNEESNENCDDFYVDHGYLSVSEGSEASNSNDNEDSDQRKRRLDHRVHEFTKQRSSKNRRAKKTLNVRIYGLTWEPTTKAMHDLDKRLMKAVVFDFPRTATKN